jgi:hypothetical protein
VRVRVRVMVRVRVRVRVKVREESVRVWREESGNESDIEQMCDIEVILSDGEHFIVSGR